MSFLLSFCTHLNPRVRIQGVYARAVDVPHAKGTKMVVSMVSWSYLRHDTRMGGHTVQARMTLHHGIGWGQGPPWPRSRSTPGRLAAYRDVSGWLTPDIRQQSRPGCPYQHGHRSNGRPFCKNVATNEDQGQNFAFVLPPPPSQRSPAAQHTDPKLPGTGRARLRGLLNTIVTSSSVEPHVKEF